MGCSEDCWSRWSGSAWPGASGASNHRNASAYSPRTEGWLPVMEALGAHLLRRRQRRLWLLVGIHGWRTMWDGELNSNLLRKAGLETW